MFALLTETTQLFQDALPRSVQVAICPERDGRARRVIGVGTKEPGLRRAPRGCTACAARYPLLTRAARVVRSQKATTDYCRHYHDCTEHTSVDAFNQRW